MLKELIISFEMFDEFEGLLDDDIEGMEDGPGLGCISPDIKTRKPCNKVRIARIHILIMVNLVFDVHALPGFTR